MPCHGCATNFTLFIKEQTCPNCKFSFCSKCLKESFSINEVNQKVCNNCFKKLTNPASPSMQHFEPPALLLKRLETLENPAKPPITIFKQKGKLSNLKSGLDPADRQIMERLEKLKEDRKIPNPPTETEIMQRLMMLKGLSERNVNEKPQPIQPPRKSEQEEVDDLLQQYMKEVNLDEKISEERNQSLEDIEERVHKLEAADNAGMKKSSGSTFEEDDGDSVSKKIIEKVIAEAKLEKNLEESGLMSDDEDGAGSADESELQWCIICNEDANVKCLGCDGSLYCHTCFKQGHEFFDMEDHQTVKVVNEES